MPGTAEHKKRLRLGVWLFGAALFLLFLGSMLFIALDSDSGASSFARDPRFVLTTKPTIGFPANPTFWQRVFQWQLKFQRKFRRPRPMSYSFPARPTNRCSIHGLLNQCMEVTGVRYAIARDVAAGSVWFGYTNTLNGVQWAKAFTEALQTGQPEWWDSKTKAFHKENLILLTNRSSIVLVLPKDLASEFQGGKTN